MTSLPLRVSAEVSDAIASGVGVVALESTIISHGLPTETSAQTAREIEAEVRHAGAVPATIAVVGGLIRVGLGDDELVQVLLLAEQFPARHCRTLQAPRFGRAVA